MRDGIVENKSKEYEGMFSVLVMGIYLERVTIPTK